VIATARRMVAGPALVVLTLLSGGCDERRAGPEPAALPVDRPADSVTVVFTRDEAPAPVQRPVPEGSGELESALAWLVRGPTAEEVAAGIWSWFSAETAGSIRSVTVDASGRVVVDFHDLRPVIPNASTSTGSRLLLAELNGTIFRIPGIDAVEYRMEGSCDLFWEWLQSDCWTVTRPQ
jgi:hypothetical protein